MPWEQIATDIYKSNNKDYLLVVDHYSNMAAVKKLVSYNAKSVIEQFKNIFMLYGLPTVLISENDPSLTSRKFQEFLSKCFITWKPSSPYYPKSNELAERTIQTIKNLMNKSPTMSV